MVKKTEIVIMSLLVVAVIILSSYAYSLIATGDSEMGDSIRKQNSIDFCESQGWAYTNRYNEDTETIWCGARTGNSVDGKIYHVQEGFFGGLKLNDAILGNGETNE